MMGSKQVVGQSSIAKSPEVCVLAHAFWKVEQAKNKEKVKGGLFQGVRLTRGCSVQNAHTKKTKVAPDEGVKHMQPASCSQLHYFNCKAALWSEWTSLQCICFWWLLIGVWKPTKFFCQTFPTSVNLTNVYLVRFQISQFFKKISFTKILSC